MSLPQNRARLLTANHSRAVARVVSLNHSKAVTQAISADRRQAPATCHSGAMVAAGRA